MKVLLLTRYGRLGASSRLRAYQYLPYLKERGIEITTAPLFGDWYQNDLYHNRRRRWSRIGWAYLHRLWWLSQSSSYDLVWMEYEALPWLPAFAERFLAYRRIAFVVDYDDAIFHRYDLHRSWIVRRLLGSKIDVIMRRAGVVVVGNSYLEARAKAAAAHRIEILPTAVDLKRYSAATPANTRPFTIGWVGSPSTAKYLVTLASVLVSFCASHEARLVVVGTGRVDLHGFPLEFRPWSEDTEVRDILSFDVGIMPLPDEPWERGKCGYKLIQYMACARPVIASPTGANAQIVVHGTNGFLATSEADWAAALEALHASHDLRIRMGAEGRRTVEAHYCTAVTGPKLAHILEESAFDG